jgi:3-hydroxyisobutyrate dehydrogenase-like beta-hydroxyacid dehydrogenase
MNSTASRWTPKIGFIGLGNMGANMARCLQKAGYSLIVHDLHESAAEELVAHGATWSASASDCAQCCELLITSLPKPDNVAAVMTGENGALAALPKGAIWVDMTTNDSELVKELAKIASEQSVTVVDAPVTGAVDGAIQGRLTIFAGGSEHALDQVQPILEAMGRVSRCGELGSGNVVKLVTNYLWFTHAAVIGEGLLLGKKAGVSLDVLWDAIKNSVGDSFVARHDAPSIFAGHYDPSFSLALCLKDLGLCEDLAQRHDVPTPIGDTVSSRFREAAARYGEQAGELHVAKLLEDAADSDLRMDGEFTPHWERGSE